MHRIAVIGSSCAGKSTLARALSQSLGYPHIELDALHWLPDWQECDTESFRLAVDKHTQTQYWITDGNYSGKLGTMLFDRADTIVWLNLPFFVVYTQMWQRIFRRIVRNEALWNGNREALKETFFDRDSLVYFIPRTWRERNLKFRQWFETAPKSKQLIELRSRAEVSAFLASCSD